MGRKVDYVLFVLFCCLLNGLSFSTIRLLGIFFINFQDDLGVSAAEASMAIGIPISILFLSGPLCAIMNDKIGERKSTFLGTSLLSIGFIAAPFMPNIVCIDILFAIAGFGLGLCNLTLYSMTGRTFKSNLAFVNNLTTGSHSLGTFALAPVVQYLNETFGWRGAILLIGGGFLEVIPVSLMTTRYYAKLQQRIHAEQAIVKETSTNQSSSVESIQIENEVEEKKKKCSIPKILKNWCFLAYATSMASGMAARVFIGIYTVRYAQSVGIEDRKAVWILGIQGILQVVFNLISGYLSTFTNHPKEERQGESCAQSVLSTMKSFRRSYILSVVYFLFSIIVLIPLFMESFTGFVIYAITSGMCEGWIGALPLTIISDMFGNKDLPVAIGTRSFLCGIILNVGPPAVGALIDATGSFKSAQIVSCICFALSFVLVVVSQAGMDKKEKAREKTT